MTNPTPEQARQFALILSSGMPSEEVIRYFLPDDAATELTPTFISNLHNKWMSSADVQRAIKQVQGKSWQEMSLEERIKFSVDKNYTEMAYFLYANNYASLTGADKIKADTCRTTLETKLAGLAGVLNPLEHFLKDFTTGKISLPTIRVLPAEGPLKSIPVSSKES